MHRSTVATLIIAAAVGLGSGSLTAVARGGSDDGSTGGAAAGPTSGTGASASLLYLDGRTLHDGDREVRLQQRLRDPVRLVRLASGWLVADRTGENTSLLWRVDEDGAMIDVTEVRDDWDLDRTRTKVAGVYAADGVLSAWSVAPGLATRLLGRAESAPEVAGVGWQGSRVLATEAADPDPGRTWVWRPGAEPRRTPVVLPAELSASADGDLVAGAVTAEGFTVTDLPNGCLLVATAPGVPAGPDGTVPSAQTCDWRPDRQAAVFSPDASLVLAIPERTDGFGPAAFGTFSSTAGPREDLAVLDAPEWTTGAQWLDDDTLLVLSRTDGELDAGTGSVLRACDRSGADCEVVAATERGAIVVGDPY
ncbi:hypothetical protein [Nocardioides marmoraquaticus]